MSKEIVKGKNERDLSELQDVMEVLNGENGALKSSLQNYEEDFE